MREVTLGDFAKLAAKRGLTPEYLAERFTNKIERPSEFFHRVFQGQYAAVVIPYRSVLAFYTSELHAIRTQLDITRYASAGAGKPFLIVKNGRVLDVRNDCNVKLSRTVETGGTGCLILLSLSRDKMGLWLLRYQLGILDGISGP